LSDAFKKSFGYQMNFLLNVGQSIQYQEEFAVQDSPFRNHDMDTAAKEY
jgi:hypothetical protein